MVPLKSLAAIFQPNLAGIVLWIAILWIDILLASGGGSVDTVSISGPVESEWHRNFGFPTMVKVSTKEVDGNLVAENTAVYWPSILVVFGFSYLVSMALGRFVKKRSLHGVGFRFVSAAVFALVASLVAAAWISQSMWNYPFSRPKILEQVGEVHSITRILTKDGRFTIDRSSSIEEDAKGNPNEDGYYNLAQRVVMMLDGAGKLPARVANLEAIRLPAYQAALFESGVLVTSEPGYESSSGLSGNIVEFQDGAGAEKVFFGLRGDQVSNDHYPYYEAVFAKAGGKLRLIDFQMFYFDIAGLEGGDWRAFLLILSIFTLPGVLILWAVIEIVWGSQRTRRAA